MCRSVKVGARSYDGLGAQSQVEPECVHAGWPHSDTAAYTLSIAKCSSMTPGQTQAGHSIGSVEKFVTSHCHRPCACMCDGNLVLAAAQQAWCVHMRAARLCPELEHLRLWYNCRFGYRGVRS